MAVKNTVSLTFHSDRPLTTQEQEALLVQVELAVTEPVTFDVLEDGTAGEMYETDWNLIGEFDLTAEFPVIGGE